MRRLARLVALEGVTAGSMGERAKAWLGLRPPLTPEELEAEPETVPLDLSGLSQAARDWLTR
jgi:hypothetical protein